ncbi:MAG: histidine kinase dimerization/phospho-acceptor domain-containing protein [Patescibacteria group bacterium]|jgi:two-component system sensor histidine kinase/response regulator
MPEEQKEFISQVSHSLKGPLTTMHLYSEALLSGSVGKLTDEQKEYVNEIHQASQKMVKMVNDLAGEAKKKLE